MKQYNSTSGDGWIKNTNWNGAVGTEDTWYGITVDADHVTSIDLGSNNLNGNVPPEIGNLTNLKELYLDYNQLSGGIPSTLPNLTNLYDCEGTPWGSNGLFINNNQLFTNDPVVKAFIDLKACPGWETTQSLAKQAMPWVPLLLLCD
jgi:hypothetical protein